MLALRRLPKGDAMKKNVTIRLALAVTALVAGCATKPEAPYVPPLDQTRKISEQDCSKPVDTGGGNLKCREVSAAEREAERERLEREAAELRARQLAEQEAREAAERERQRLEHEWLAGRAMLENFVATYGNVSRFKGVSGQINTFLDKTR
jgi:hypothetical protein